MSYANGHPVRLVGGRLALDFVNTADWSADASVTHEKITTEADLGVWLDALGLSSAKRLTDIDEVRAFRGAVRSLLLGGNDYAPLLQALQFDRDAERKASHIVSGQPLEALIAASALTILSDRRERDRLKTCPGKDCGWLFIDETKNARRRWCIMETCGNRAKSARHYARRTEKGGGT